MYQSKLSSEIEWEANTLPRTRRTKRIVPKYVERTEPARITPRRSLITTNSSEDLSVSSRN